MYVSLFATLNYIVIIARFAVVPRPSNTTTRRSTSYVYASVYAAHTAILLQAKSTHLVPRLCGTPKTLLNNKLNTPDK